MTATTQQQHTFKSAMARIPTTFNNILNNSSLLERHHHLRGGGKHQQHQGDSSSSLQQHLPEGYAPTEYDVICGRGKKNWNHKGNVAFRNLVHATYPRYMDAPTKNEKSMVVLSLVDHVRVTGGKFLKQDNKGAWYDIGDAQAREKAGHSLRDQVTALSRQQQQLEQQGGKRGCGKRKQQQKVSQDCYPAGPPTATSTMTSTDDKQEEQVVVEMDLRRSSQLAGLLTEALSRRQSMLMDMDLEDDDDSMAPIRLVRRSSSCSSLHCSALQRQRSSSAMMMMAQPPLERTSAKAFRKLPFAGSARSPADSWLRSSGFVPSITLSLDDIMDDAMCITAV